MKKFLVIGILLIGVMCFASRPAKQDCIPAPCCVMQTADPVMPALLPEAVVFYELPFAGTIPELGAPIVAAEPAGFSSGIWRPPVIIANRLKSTLFYLQASYDPVLTSGNILCQTPYGLNPNKLFYICWYDIA